MNVDAMLLALHTLFSFDHFLFLVAGTLIGLIIGLLPGLGGLAGLSLVMPFVFGLEPTYALALMIGLLAPTTTSDTFPSILMGIPGSAASQATVLDGFPMTQRGEATRALGAALSASLIGGVFGALVLTVAVVFAGPLLLAIGFGEQLMLMLIALSLIGTLTGRSSIKGLAAGALGLLIGSIGFAPTTGESRFMFDNPYLMGGIPVVILALGLYVIPEIFKILGLRRPISDVPLIEGGLFRGIRDTLRNWWLVIRCSFLGSFFGAIPGIGGSVINWLTYAHVVQTTRGKSDFGNGDVRGVIGPEAANNSMDGGALIPALLFGIPGSGTMALLLGGFIILGIQPGVAMATTELHLSYLIIWTLAIGNILAAALCFGLAGPISRIVRVPFGLLGPFMLVLVVFAAFQATRMWGDLVALMTLGVVGVILKEYGWSRPAVLVGAVLAPRLEAAFYQTSEVYGLEFLQRPTVLLLGVLLVASLFTSFISLGAKNAKLPPPASDADRWRQVGVAGSLLLMGALGLLATRSLSPDAALFPRLAAVALVVCSGVVLLWLAFSRSASTVFVEAESDGLLSGVGAKRLLSIFGIFPLTYLLGLVPAVLIFIFVGLSAWWERRLLLNAMLATATAGVFVLLSGLMDLQYPSGLLQNYVDYPFWLSG